MTICIATICRWNYKKSPEEKDEMGWAVLTASDRMLTDEGLGIQYETGQGKWAKVANRVVVLVADSIAIHSDAIVQLRKDLEFKQDASPWEVAELYSKHITKRRETDAERSLLSPFGLTMAQFVKLMKDMDANVVHDLANDIMNYEIKAEAIVAGVDINGAATIYSVNNRGIVMSHTDIGFAAIGIGAVHSVPYFMSHSFWNGWSYYPTLQVTYAAKKAAEIAPGVGKATDMLFISRDAAFTIYEGQRLALETSYPRHIKRIQKAEKVALDELMKYERDYMVKHPPQKNPEPAGSPQDESVAKSAKDQT